MGSESVMSSHSESSAQHEILFRGKPFTIDVSVVDKGEALEDGGRIRTSIIKVNDGRYSIWHTEDSSGTSEEKFVDGKLYEGEENPGFNKALEVLKFLREKMEEHHYGILDLANSTESIVKIFNVYTS